MFVLCNFIITNLLYSEWYGDIAGYIGEGILVTTGGNAGAGTFPRDILVGKPKNI